ncbi:glutathione S-transferase family protein [Paracidovorax citrulli]
MSQQQERNPGTGKPASGEPEYRLYCFAQSGNAYKVALMLETLGVQRGAQLWVPRFVDFFNGETRTPAYRAINVMGEVPVLEFGDQRLTQSGAILDLLARRLDAYGPRDESERAEILRWLLFDNHKFTSYMATYRFLRNFARDPDPVILQYLRGRCEAAWRVLDAHLDGRRFAAADRCTIADFSLAGYVFYEDEIGVDWQADYPHIHAWMQRIRELPGWQHPYNLMPGHPLPAKNG